MTRVDFDEKIRPDGAYLVGSPEEAAEKIIRLHKLFGHDRTLIQMAVGDMAHLNLMRAIELLGARVLPLIPERPQAGLPPVLASGRWFTAAGEGRAAYLWRDDLALACAASLRAGGSVNRKLDISGPEALSPQDIIATVNEAFGVQAEVVPVSDEQLAAGLRAAGLPEAQVEIFAAFDLNTRLGRVDSANPAFKQLTGESPRSLRDYLIANRAALLAAGKANLS